MCIRFIGRSLLLLFTVTIFSRLQVTFFLKGLFCGCLSSFVLVQMSVWYKWVLERWLLSLKVCFFKNLYYFHRSVIWLLHSEVLWSLLWMLGFDYPCRGFGCIILRSWVGFTYCCYAYDSIPADRYDCLLCKLGLFDPISCLWQFLIVLVFMQ